MEDEEKMDEKNKNVRAFLPRLSKRAFYLTTFLAAIAITYGVLSGFVSTTVSAQEDAVVTPGNRIATPEMLAVALDFRTAGNFKTWSNADTAIDEAGGIARKDLSESIDRMMGLPCSRVENTNLTGKRFAAGVYCLDSAELAGEMMLNAGGDTAAVFIFRIAGSLNAKGARISLEEGAQAANAFFVAGDSAEIGGSSDFGANVMARGNVTVNDGSALAGRALTLGDLSASENSTLGVITPGFGVIEICKAQAPFVGANNDLSNRIFNFVVSGVVGPGPGGSFAVAVNSCTRLANVPVGPQTITELNTGQTITPAGNFTGGFQLINVQNLTPNSSSTLTGTNLNTRVASINVVAGGISEVLILRFTNRRAIIAVIEICKLRARNVPLAPIVPQDAAQDSANGLNSLQFEDPDVEGFFEFTIEGVFSSNSLPGSPVLQRFAVMTGQCSPPIFVLVGPPTPNVSPNQVIVRVSELPTPDAFCEGAAELQTTPGRLLAFTPNAIVNAAGAVVPSQGGCFATVRLVEGDQNNEAVIAFINRSRPGIVKVCKLAGPGVPINTLFRFRVRGFGYPFPPGPPGIGPGPNPPAQFITRFVDVRAGSLDSGGSCFIVEDDDRTNDLTVDQNDGPLARFVIGAPVEVLELGVSPQNTIPQPVGTLLASRVRVFNTSFTPFFFAAEPSDGNPDLTPGTQTIAGFGGPAQAYIARAAAAARREEIVFEFVNFRFRQSVIKICKFATGSAIGQTFTFDVALVSPVSQPGNVPIFPPFGGSISVTTDADGECTLPFALFSAGLTFTITEQQTIPATTVTSVVCDTCLPGTSSPDAANRRITIFDGGGAQPTPPLPINIVTFRNSPAAVGGRPEYDFDGDGKSDPSLFRPATASWYMAESSNGYATRVSTFGLSTDIQIAADYDGDRITDQAVFRPSTGEWHVLGSTNVYFVKSWGLNGDIPLTGDFDGDGLDDYTVFRPSTSVWYHMLSRDGFLVRSFGIAGDKPATADYDGDNITDISVTRNSGALATWYFLKSTAGFTGVDFGYPTDRPVPADYDGDGKADVAVFRAEGNLGVWYYLGTTNVFRAISFGLAGDKPVPADYDGDDIADFAVFRPSNGTWYIKSSNDTPGAGAPATVNLGNSSDVPLAW